MTKKDLLYLVLALPLTIAYLLTHHWFLNNTLGLLFAIIGIQSLSLPNFKVAFVLLWGLFFYDIFWVYGTDVMLTVAKSLDAPIKLMFPVNLAAETPKFSMLGLGDIVIPGIFVGLCIRYDFHRRLSKETKVLTQQEIESIQTPYFNWAMIGYAMGIIITFTVMIVSGSAQPALLFLVPAICIASLVTAYMLGDFKEMWEYEEVVPVEDEKKDETKGNEEKTEKAD